MPQTMINFNVDNRIASSCFILTDWPLSRVFLKNNAHYPWLILVPRHADIQDIDQLPGASQQILMQEITALSTLVKAHFTPDKINIGALGNIVSQLHIHVIARFTNDNLWPHGVWQENLISEPYSESAIQVLLHALRTRLHDYRFI